MLTLLKSIKLMTGGGSAAAPWLISLLALCLSFRGPSAGTKAKDASQSDATFKTITAEQIVIVDKKGQKRIEMSGSSISLFDPKGVCRASLNVRDRENFGEFVLRGIDGKPAASLVEKSDGSAQLIIGNPDKEAVWLNKSEMIIWRKGIRTIELSAELDYPSLVIRDKTGLRRSVLGFQDDDLAIEAKTPFLFLFDSHKRLRVSVGGAVATKEEEQKPGQPGGGIVIFDTNQHPIWHAP